jgi:GNAT superfamily N-acetyltransferase
LATREDIPALATLMIESYVEASFTLSHEAAARAFTTFLADSRLGHIWVLGPEGAEEGYVVMTVSFSMEYGGLRGFVDDFFVRPRARNKGLGAAALDALKHACPELGIRVLLVETGPEGHPARRLYERAGFVENGRVFLTQTFAAPVHEV